MTSPVAIGSAFISYRWASWANARLVRESLMRRGCDAFIDHEGIGSGPIDQMIFTEIANRPNFIVIVEHDSMARIHTDDDWVRREVAYAFRCGRNVVPLSFNGFAFPRDARLPLDIAQLQDCRPLPVVMEYFEEGMDRLCAHYLRRGPVGVPSMVSAAPSRRSAAATAAATWSQARPLAAVAVAAQPAPRPPDNLTRVEKTRVSNALLGALAGRALLPLPEVQDVLVAAMPRILEPDWCGPSDPRSFVWAFLRDFPVSDAGVSAPLDAAPPQRPPQTTEQNGTRVPARSPAPASAPASAPAPAPAPAARTGAKAAKPQGAKSGPGKDQPAQPVAARRPEAKAKRSAPAARPPSEQRVPAPRESQHPARRKDAAVRAEAPQQADVNRARKALFRKFELTNPITLAAAAQVIETAAPRLHELTRGSLRQVIVLLREHFPFVVVEVEPRSHVVYKNAMLTPSELEKGADALDAALDAADGPLRLDAARDVLLAAMPRLSGDEWAGDGTVSAFIENRYRQWFKLQDLERVRYVKRRLVRRLFG